MDAVLLARQRGSCYICFSATADRSGLTSRSDHKKKKGENPYELPPCEVEIVCRQSLTVS